MPFSLPWTRNYHIHRLLARAHLIIKGLVQGVFFRASTIECARAENCTGWVRNRPDGTVEAIIEGEEDAVKRVIEWCRTGPPMARVDDVLVTWEDYCGEFDDFSMR